MTTTVRQATAAQAWRGVTGVAVTVAVTVMLLGAFLTLSSFAFVGRLSGMSARRAGVHTLGGVYHAVMFLGDSVTAGWTNDGAHAYPVDTINELFTKNGGNAWYQLVKGRTGAQASGALVDLQAFAVQPKNVNLLIIELGTNDMVHMSAATFQTNYQSLVSYLLAGSPNAQLVCLGPWRSSTDNFGYDSEPAYAAAIASVCQGSSPGALYLDLTALYANPANHPTTGDTFHPNDTGSQAIADLIVNAVYPS